MDRIRCACLASRWPEIRAWLTRGSYSRGRAEEGQDGEAGRRECILRWEGHSLPGRNRKAYSSSVEINEKTQKFIDERGAWTAMAIKLADGTYTRRPAVDYRLKRLVQCAEDLVKKPLKDCRVLDLACLEGHYAIEFALRGAEAVGIEARDVNLEKCEYAREMLTLDRVRFVKDDVRSLSRAKYGLFDIVICSGILYHLPAHDAVEFIRQLAETCSGVLLLDTYVSLYGRERSIVGRRELRGHFYFEHNNSDDTRTRSERLWASIDNVTSFWVTQASLLNLLSEAGFTSVLEVLTPPTPGFPKDRKTYAAVRGTPARIHSSDLTDAIGDIHVAEGESSLMDGSQRQKSVLFRFAKRVLPPSVKTIIKPALRAIRVLPPDQTPEFMRKK